MIKRPIVVACIGYIFGIILGLYFNKSIALFLGYICIIAITVNKCYKSCRSKYCSSETSQVSLRKMKRYIKVFFPKKAILIFCICMVIGYSYVNVLNKKYEKIYNIDGTILVKGVVVSVQEQEYSNKYEVEVKQINGKRYIGVKSLMYIRHNQTSLSYGDYIEFKAEYKKPDDSRNYKGFSYRDYLKQDSIYGIIIPETKINVLSKNKCDSISIIANKVRNSIIKKARDNLEGETANVFLGILLGEKNQISNEINSYFKDSNMAHILAVSGAHISYVILTISIVLSKTGKRISRIITIIILMFFMVLVGFTPSVVRACVMAIIALIAKLIYRKSDTYNNLAISCLVILLVNPYNILNIGFQLSFLGTLGIIILNIKYKGSEGGIITQSHDLRKFIVDIIKVSTSVQLFIMPITIINFNVFSLNFLLSGLIATPIFSGIMIVGIIALLSGFIGIYLFPIIELLVNLLIFISKLISNIPFSKFILRTPYIIWIISYYIVLALVILSRNKDIIRIVKDKKKKTNY